MKSFKISHQNAGGYLRWILWISLGLAVIYFALAINAYTSGEERWEWIFNIIIGLIWMASGFFQIVGSRYYFPEITLNDSGITYSIKKSQKLVRWNQIQDIYLDNNTLVLHTETNKEEELNIAHLEYKELQTVKQQLQKFTSDKDITYSSKY